MKAFFKIIDHIGNVRLLKITDERISMVGKDGTNMSLSYITEVPAEMEESLLEAADAKAAKNVLTHYVYPHHKIESWTPYRG